MAFERGAHRARATDGGEQALDLEAWYLTSAVLVPQRAPEAHRRVDTILARRAALATSGGRMLASKALIMRAYAAAPHGELVALARDLLRRQVVCWTRAGSPSRPCARGRHVELLRRVRGGRGDPRPRAGGDAARRLGDLGRRRQSTAGAPATLDRVDLRRRRGCADRSRTSCPAGCRCTFRRRRTADPRPCSSATSPDEAPVRVFERVEAGEVTPTGIFAAFQPRVTRAHRVPTPRGDP